MTLTHQRRWPDRGYSLVRKRITHIIHQVGRFTVASTRAFRPALAAVEVTVAAPHTPAALAAVAPAGPLDLASTADRPAAAGASVRALVDVTPAPVPATVDGKGVGVADRAGHLGTVELGSDTPRSLPLAKPVRADDRCMARLGRRPVPSGPNSDTAGTWNLTVRMPASFKEHVTARGAQQGLSCSDVIANAVAQVLDLAPVMTPRNVDEDQGELLAS